ncbi:HD domain-containing protein [Oceanimonas sp. CAM02]|uniref:HD domain-containing protein n=1 Tax=Oceanimonas sp. CAM02 TaxID=3080336 RepID=UPI00293679EF|nr:TraI domain-containing protein [Oceanimonas sp. CAM02]MDV2858228.1 TraI domain-containing protein [Oceanimonas sp. CAM02]
MNPMVMTHQRPQLLWASQLFDDGALASWQFSASAWHCSLSLEPWKMQGVSPYGQWVLVELNEQEGHFRLKSVQTLPEGVSRQQVEHQLAWLPESQQALLMDVWSMLAVIDDEVLRDFLLDILSNDAIMAPFCESRASHRHHHDQPGGLLVHSHEVAITAAMLCSQYGLGQRSIWVAFLGGLLHDIGKIRLYYNENAGICGQHESFNFLVLGQQLEQLRLASPKVFEALSACLETKVGKYTDPYQVANIVRMCDRLSADVANWKSAFAGVPAHFWYARCPRDQQWYKRLG